jgi:hypothetical protein
MVAALVVSAVASVAAAAESASMASKQATVASKVANYNANVDIANANQQAMDANANIAKQRQADATYMSSQRAALAASGVLENTGSPLSLEATTAGRMEQNIQQYWTTVQEKEDTEFTAARMGIYEGQEEASIYHLEGAADIFKGIGEASKSIGGIAQYEKGLG